MGLVLRGLRVISEGWIRCLLSDLRPVRSSGSAADLGTNREQVLNKQQRDDIISSPSSPSQKAVKPGLILFGKDQNSLTILDLCR